MKLKQIELFTFKELSEEAQQKALDELYDINVGYDWYDFTYEDAKNIGFKISEFDIDRGNYCKGALEWYLLKTIRQILQDHGKETETYKLADVFLLEVEKLQNEINYGGENSFDAEEKLEEIEKEFALELSEIYLAILRNTYECQTSKEARIETIEANEYEFTIDGKLS